MSTSDHLRAAARTAEPYATAMIHAGTLTHAADELESSKRFAFFAGAVAVAVAAVAVGLLLALLYVGTFYPPTECAAPASELTGDPERMELEPMRIGPEKLTAKGVITI